VALDETPLLRLLELGRSLVGDLDLDLEAVLEVTSGEGAGSVITA
jgi:hypothetical protein